MDEGEKEGKSSSERQAAKKPAYKPTLVYRSVGGERMGQQQQGLKSLKHIQSKGSKGSRPCRDPGCSQGGADIEALALRCAEGSEQPPG